MTFTDLKPQPVVLAVTASTNDEAKHLAVQGAPHGAAVVAQRQTAGRGRMGRTFLSPDGGIYLSVVLRPQGTAAQLRHLTLLFADAVCEAVFSVCGETCEIKWPNDVLLGGKKLAGILTEGAIAADGTFAWLVCGVGLNVGAVPQSVAELAAALAEPVDREALATAIIRALTDAALVSQAEAMRRLDRIRKNCATLGKTVALHDSSGVITAFAEAINDDGSLQIVEPNGTRRKLSSGEVLIVKIKRRYPL